LTRRGKEKIALALPGSGPTRLHSAEILFGFSPDLESDWNNFTSCNVSVEFVAQQVMPTILQQRLA
jgi:hypothetical protein